MAFSIKQLLLLIAVVATGLTAMLNARWPAAQFVAELLTLCVVVAMAYGIWFGSGAGRAYRISFLGWWLLYSIPLAGLSVFGTLSVVLLDAVAPAFRPDDPGDAALRSPTSSSIATRPTITTDIWANQSSQVLQLFDPLSSDVAAISPPPMNLSPPTVSFGTLVVSSPTTTSAMLTMTGGNADEWRSRFYTIGHCLIGVLLGLLGGWVTEFLYRRRERKLASV